MVGGSMKQTRSQFTHDELLNLVRKEILASIKAEKIEDANGCTFSNADCLMSGLAVFTFKYPSLLKFDEARHSDKLLKGNLKNLFQLNATPSDTQMRARIDQIPPTVLRSSFTKIFSLVQRGNILKEFRFLDKYYLVASDGTGTYSSEKICCENCCIKKHSNGSTSFYHGALGLAIVHPDQKIVIPLAPEIIYKEDGSIKNDCEQNASKRAIKKFRKEHPHLPVVFVEDGLYANAPHIRELEANNIRYIIGCCEDDHKHLMNHIKDNDIKDKITHTETNDKGITGEYEIYKNVPLNGTADAPLVTVVRYKETNPNKQPRKPKPKKKRIKKGKKLKIKNSEVSVVEIEQVQKEENCLVTQWMWVTDLPVTLKNVNEFMKGARARFHIENQTFNTLKNQGYEFEHNYGHGKKHLNHVFTHLMMLAFLIDQCLEKVNKRYQEALKFFMATYA
jgi:hypothetical protein